MTELTIIAPQTISADDPATAVSLASIDPGTTYLISVANDGASVASLSAAAAAAATGLRVPADGATYTYGPFSVDVAISLFATAASSCIVSLQQVASEG